MTGSANRAIFVLVLAGAGQSMWRMLILVPWRYQINIRIEGVRGQKYFDETREIALAVLPRCAADQAAISKTRDLVRGIAAGYSGGILLGYIKRRKFSFKKMRMEWEEVSIPPGAVLG